MNAQVTYKWSMDEATGRQFLTGSRIENFGDVVAYISDLHNVILAFRGRAKKAFSNYRYKNAENMKEALVKIKKAEKERLDRKVQEKELDAKQAEEFLNSLEIGSVLYTSWGYDQTNIDYYQVIDIKGKTVTIQAIESVLEENGFMSYNATPKVNAFCGEPIKKRVTSPHIKISDFEFARLAEFEKLADGSKKYKSKVKTTYG